MARFTRSRFSNFYGKTNGSAIDLTTTEPIIVDRCSFAECNSTEYGGAIMIRTTNDSPIKLRFVTFQKCYCYKWGLAAYLGVETQVPKVSISCVSSHDNSFFGENTNDKGGVISIERGTVSITDYNASKNLLPDWHHGSGFMTISSKTKSKRVHLTDSTARDGLIVFYEMYQSFLPTAVVSFLVAISSTAIVYSSTPQTGIINPRCQIWADHSVFRDNVGKPISTYHALTQIMSIEDCMFDTSEEQMNADKPPNTIVNCIFGTKVFQSFYLFDCTKPHYRGRKQSLFLLCSSLLLDS